MKNNTFVFPRNSGLLLLCLLVSLLVGISKAQAGGYEPPPEATEKKEPPLLNWEKWAAPYAWQKNICREKQGNIVCLGRNVAQNFGWLQPSSQRLKSPPKVKR